MNPASEPAAAGAPPAAVSGVRQIVRHVGAALRARWGVGLLLLGGLLIEMSFSAAVPMSFKYLVDYAIIPRDEKILIAILLGQAASLLAASSAGLGLDYLYTKFSTGVLNDLRWRMFTHLQRLSMNFSARTLPRPAQGLRGDGLGDDAAVFHDVVQAGDAAFILPDGVCADEAGASRASSPCPLAR